MSGNVYRVFTAIALFATVSLGAQSPLNVRLATLAPDNSPWTSALRSMGTAWEKTTERRVRLTVYAGTIPSESSAIARMAVDGLQAATLMVPGLSEIDEAFNVFGIPLGRSRPPRKIRVSGLNNQELYALNDYIISDDARHRV